MSFGCGPEVSTASGTEGADDDSTSIASVSSSTISEDSSTSSLSSEESTTSSKPACGDGLFEADEWCFERQVVSLEGHRADAYRVLAGGQGEPGFSLWDSTGFHLLESGSGGFAVATASYYPTLGTYDPSAVVYYTKLLLGEGGRVDLLHATRIPGTCRQSFAVPAASRDPLGKLWEANYQLNDLDCVVDEFVFPIKIPGTEVDAFFATDGLSGRSALYGLEFPGEGYFGPGDLSTETLQWMEAEAPCGVRLGHAANAIGDEREEAVLLADECDDDGEFAILAHQFDGQQRLSDAPIRLGSFSLPGDPLSWLVLPTGEDGHQSFVVAGAGFAVLISFDDSGSPVNTDLSLDAEPLQLSTDDAALDRIPLGSGGFRPDAPLDIAVSTADGVSIVARDGHHKGEFADMVRSFAVSDFNDDGWADIAVLGVDEIVVHVSNP